MKTWEKCYWFVTLKRFLINNFGSSHWGDSNPCPSSLPSPFSGPGDSTFSPSTFSSALHLHSLFLSDSSILSEFAQLFVLFCGQAARLLEVSGQLVCVSLLGCLGWPGAVRHLNECFQLWQKLPPHLSPGTAVRPHQHFRHPHHKCKVVKSGNKNVKKTNWSFLPFRGWIP
jgi:hypothetical protein